MKLPWVSLESLDSRLELSESVEPEGVAPDCEPLFLDFAGPIRVNILVTKTRKGWRLALEVRFRARFSCARCLEHFSLECKALERWTVVTEGEKADRLIVAHGDRLELETPFRETVLLALPDRPLCGVDCPGLCLHCGKRRPCGCPEEEERVHRLALKQALLEAKPLQKGKG